jgi:hypothetical protein
MTEGTPKQRERNKRHHWRWAFFFAAITIWLIASAVYFAQDANVAGIAIAGVFSAFGVYCTFDAYKESRKWR